jgi:fructose-bisphosphate aldolase, class II
MLTTLREILCHARANRYAVPGFDCIEDVMVRTILETAEARRSPVIMMCLSVDLEGNGWAYVPGLVRAVADHHNVPVALHLDHANDLDTIRRGIDSGFTSVMIDGSALPFEENVRLTRAAVEMARPHGISVEAELGHVGGSDLVESSKSEGNVLTEPDEVARFVAETEVDALAVSIGTSHGMYASLPNLDIECLKQLNAASRVPLVLHGGSGTPDDQIRHAVANGIVKLNIYADLRVAMFRGLIASSEIRNRPDPLPREMFRPINEAMAAVVEEKIALLGSANRV